MRGQATLIRYCDDFVMCFELQSDAERVMTVLGKRMGRYGLTLHPEKTRLLPFGRPSRRQHSGKGATTFDFLGFTLYWQRTRWGTWWMQCKTRCGRLRRTIQSIGDFCRRHRHQPVEAQHAALTRRMVGHYNYFGVRGNFRSLLIVVEEAKRAWYKWLQRRSQKRHLNWERYEQLLKRFPLPRPRIRVQLRATT